LKTFYFWIYATKWNTTCPSRKVSANLKRLKKWLLMIWSVIWTSSWSPTIIRKDWSYIQESIILINWVILKIFTNTRRTVSSKVRKCLFIWRSILQTRIKCLKFLIKEDILSSYQLPMTSNKKSFKIWKRKLDFSLKIRKILEWKLS